MVEHFTYRLILACMLASTCQVRGKSVSPAEYEQDEQGNRVQVVGCTFQVFKEKALLGFNHHIIKNSSMPACAESCLEHLEFECRSFDYVQHSKTCFLSREDRHTQDFYFLNARRVSYFEKTCLTFVSTPPEIEGYRSSMDKSVGSVDDDVRIFQPASLLQCEHACFREITDAVVNACSSFEYTFVENLCLLRGDVTPPEELIDSSGTLYQQIVYLSAPTTPVPTTPVPTTPIPSHCPYGWEGFEDHCYKFIKDVDRTWAQARRACADEIPGAHLVSIGSQEEMDFVTQKINALLIGETWELWWTSGRYDHLQQTWFWDDGKGLEAFPVGLWYPGEPNNQGSKEYHVDLLYKYGDWGFNDGSQYHRLRSVCEVEDECENPCMSIVDPCAHAQCPAFPYAVCTSNYCKSCEVVFYYNGEPVNCSSTEVTTTVVIETTQPVTNPPVTIPTIQCPSGWQSHNGSCYRYHGDSAMRWVDAGQVCAQQGGHLVSIESQAEHNFVITNLDQDNAWWTAGTRKGNQWVWDYGHNEHHPWTYENWNYGEPNNDGGREDSVGLQYNYGRWGWNDGDGDVLDPFVCEASPAQVRTGCDSSPCLNGGSCTPQGDPDSSIDGSGSVEGSGYGSGSGSESGSGSGYGSGEVYPFSDDEDYTPFGDDEDYSTINSDMLPDINPHLFTCVCPQGFSGELCQVDAHEYWEDFEDHQYKLFPNYGKSWAGAVMTCQEYGAYVVAIDSESELEFIGGLLDAANYRNEHIPWWTSGKRRGKYEWVWQQDVQEIPLTYSLWNTGEPNNYNGREDYIEIRFDSYLGYRMNDIKGSKLNGFICERDIAVES